MAWKGSGVRIPSAPLFALGRQSPRREIGSRVTLLHPARASSDVERRWARVVRPVPPHAPQGARSCPRPRQTGQVLDGRSQGDSARTCPVPAHREQGRAMVPVAWHTAHTAHVVLTGWARVTVGGRRFVVESYRSRRCGSDRIRWASITSPSCAGLPPGVWAESGCSARARRRYAALICDLDASGAMPRRA